MRTLAYDYPLLSIFWSMLWFAVLVAWIMALFSVLTDVFRSHDMGGFAKTIWVLVILVMPILGVLIYLLARGDKMTEHAVAQAQAQEQMMRSYVQDAAASAGGGNAADQLAKLADLRDRGAITEAEFEQGKAQILA
jgi:hypothetical protein